MEVLYKTCCLMMMLVNLVFIQTVKGQHAAPPDFKNCKKCIVLSEQSVDRAAILDLTQKKIVWEWRAKLSGIKPEHFTWFKHISDAKAVYNGEYILTTASGGGVALVRISDKKLMFYAYAGGNTHSAELLPDGNIVTASSNGNYITVFRTDTLNFPDHVYHKNIPVAFAHNVVWDKKNKVLWTASNNKLKIYTYNFNCEMPDLLLTDSIGLPGAQAHDLFPVYGKNALWISNTTSVFKYHINTKKLEKISVPYKDVKSISSGPGGYPTLLIAPENTYKAWWTDDIHSLNEPVIFKQEGLKMYKARWFIENSFSYQPGSTIRVCNDNL
ncbi:hypothetical protein FW774_00670 (plasmid) [Pedobacter sp. BS3]|uniref:DUF6528 family protein n=1 Tax=Pedobacter sp. BS3 TaxID=2567937 RepID=UPI0011F05276|nr:DUF6528 family protein [Pedobacter sp. BS3]TZF85624.1 hypothetical protein FW774_00670 [Pedobacter sp. BS3]